MLYERAIRSARTRGEPATEGLARAFFARIATGAGDPKAKEIVQEAAKAVPQLPSIGALYVVQGLVNEEKRKKLEATASARVAKRSWSWDAVSNTLTLFDK